MHSRVSLKNFITLSILFVIPLSHIHAESADVKSLINTIRHGGYVLYMRHAASNRSQTDTDTVNLDDCSKQ